MRESLVVSAITFHGGESSLTYPWGIEDYQKKTSPDDKAFSDIASMLQEQAGNGPMEMESIQQYNIGSMNDVVYSAKGPLEDYMYALSWDSSHVVTCTPHTAVPYPAERQKPMPQTHRSFIYLVEAASDKQPMTKDFGDDESWDNKGHVSRNMIVSKSVVDFAAPTLKVNTLQLKDGILEMNFEGVGCLNVDSFDIEISDKGGNNIKKFSVDKIEGNQIQKKIEYPASESFSSQMNIKASMKCDQKWISNNAQKTHFSKVRNPSYVADSEENTINGAKFSNVEFNYKKSSHSGDRHYYTRRPNNSFDQISMNNFDLQLLDMTNGQRIGDLKISQSSEDKDDSQFKVILSLMDQLQSSSNLEFQTLSRTSEFGNKTLWRSIPADNMLVSNSKDSFHFTMSKNLLADLEGQIFRIGYSVGSDYKTLIKGYFQSKNNSSNTIVNRGGVYRVIFKRVGALYNVFFFKKNNKWVSKIEFFEQYRKNSQRDFQISMNGLFVADGNSGDEVNPSSEEFLNLKPFDSITLIVGRISFGASQIQRSNINELEDVNKLFMRLKGIHRPDRHHFGLSYPLFISMIVCLVVCSFILPMIAAHKTLITHFRYRFGYTKSTSDYGSSKRYSNIADVELGDSSATKNGIQSL